MRRLAVGGLFALAVSTLTLAQGQPPGGKQGGKKDKGPPPFRMGKVLPPFAREELDLSKEQLGQLADLEKDVRARLEKILTDKQRKQLEGPRGRVPKGGFKGKGDGPPRKGKDKGDLPVNDGQAGAATGGIQWFATLERGLAEAKRTNRPVLFLAAAPHCGGVPGIW
jgi:hypothetical protein